MQRISPRYPLMEQFPDEGTPQQQVAWNLVAPPQAGSSAELAPYLTVQQNPQLEALKQQVIQRSGFRPAAQRYFNKVPVFTLSPGDRAAGRAFTEMNPVGIVGMQPMSGQVGEQVMLHELLHTAPRPILTGSNPYEDYLNAYNKSKVVKGSSLLYTGGKGYAGPEETYATVGEVLGQGARYTPIVGKYYEGVFAPGIPKTKHTAVKSGGISKLLQLNESQNGR